MFVDLFDSYRLVGIQEFHGIADDLLVHNRVHGVWVPWTVRTGDPSAATGRGLKAMNCWMCPATCTVVSREINTRV